MPPRNSTESPLIVIDSREQRPFTFPNAITKALATGDYSVDGFFGFHFDRT
jgi:hypothetical protein